ncbi:MAG: glycosyltransferase [Mediterranea massiliensis]|nr:glycosyltransferase [Mediterranea massiliensis]
MKTLYVFDDYQLSLNNGVGTYIKELTRLIDDMEDVRMVMIMLRSNVKESSVYICNNMEYILFPKSETENSFRDTISIIALLQKHINDTIDNIFLFNYTPCNYLLCKLASEFPLSKRISVVHDFNWTTYFKGNISLFNKYIIKYKKEDNIYKTIKQIYLSEKEQYFNSDKIICLSEDAYMILKVFYGISIEKIILIPHGIKQNRLKNNLLQKDKLRLLYGIDKSEKIILSVGRISEAKGTFVLLEALKELQLTELKFRWVIVGDLKNMEDLLIKAGNLVTKMIFTGYINKKTLMQLYKMADVGILSSYTEQCSYVGLEMMNCGLPIVATDAIGIRCMFKNGINACISPIKNTKKTNLLKKNLLKSILLVLNNPTLQIKLKLNGYRILKEKYSYNSMKEKYNTLFQTI